MIDLRRVQRWLFDRCGIGFFPSRLIGPLYRWIVYRARALVRRESGF
jgi:hypothetical protein